LLFKPDFFAGTEYKNSFKKGKIYRFCFSGEFKKNSGNIIESIKEGNFEVNELSEVVPFIRSLYKEKEKSAERKNLAEKELEEKRNIIKEMNEERSGVKGELSDLESKFSRLQFEKTKIETE